jgi:acyl dehydratase
VYGLLTASFLSTLAGLYLPGKYSLIQKIDIDFLHPVYIDDVLSVEGIVTGKHDLFRYIRLKVNISRQNGEKVLRGKMRIGVTA